MSNHKYSIGQQVTVNDAAAHPSTGRPPTWRGTILRLEDNWSGPGYSISQDEPKRDMPLFVSERDILDGAT